MYCKCIQFGNNTVAAGIVNGTAKFLIIVPDMIRYFQFQLWYCFVVAGENGGVDCFCDVKYHIVIMLVFVVSVAVPVAGMLVYLNIADPKNTTDFYFCIEEIRPGVSVDQSCIDYFHFLLVSGQ